MLDTRLTVFVSCPKSDNLSNQQLQLRDAIFNRLGSLGFRIQHDGAVSDRLSERILKARDAHGVLILALAQWKGTRMFRSQAKEVIFPSEFNHLAAAMAVAARRPILVLKEKRVADRGALRKGYVHPVIELPNSLSIDWVNSDDFSAPMEKWAAEVNEFKHVFLGYSSQASPTGDLIGKFLQEKMKLRVFDWHDFRPGDSIWDSIERAERLTNCGIFLFMTDDKLSSNGEDHLAPRDNVVYEAGFFAGSKGRAKSLIVRQADAKIPSDLGGILYLGLNGPLDIASIEGGLRNHLERMLAR